MRVLLLVPLLAACAAQPGAPVPGEGAVRPVEAILYRDTVTAAMSDGTLCTGVREGRSGPWATRLGGCPHGWPVEVLRETRAPRLPLAPTAADPWVTLAPPGAPPLGFAPRGGA